VDFSQHASNSWVGKVKTGQEGSLIATMVAHAGCNRGVGGLKGTKVGKHCDVLETLTPISISKIRINFFLFDYLFYLKIELNLNAFVTYSTHIIRHDVLGG
jgi:hypothetical protein